RAPPPHQARPRGRLPLDPPVPRDTSAFLAGRIQGPGPKEMAIAMTRLAGLLGDVRAASALRYDAPDSAGNRMDTAKVIPSPTGGYLAVYHDGEVCHLAASTNLME